jgi:DNA-binding CsgD family transcriptional regulator
MSANRGKPPGKATPHPGNGPSPRRRGRPPGTPSLTKEVEDIVVTCVAGGASLAAAAQAAGISARTLRDYLARGRDQHASRPSSPKLRRFARRVEKVRGETRVVAENRMFSENPKHWLMRQFAETADDEGWRDAPARGGSRPGSALDLASMSDEELTASLHRLLEVAAGQVARARAGSGPRRKDAA